MIDLEQFVGKEVVVTREDGITVDGVIEGEYTLAYPYFFHFRSYTRDGYYCRDKNPCYLNIKSIKLKKEKPMIDLEQFVGKKVVVTLEKGTTREGVIEKDIHQGYPYSLLYGVNNGRRDTYTRDGYFWAGKTPCDLNIKSITLKSDNLDNFLDWAEKATLEELDSYLTVHKNNNKVAAFLKKNLFTIFFPIIICYGFFIPKHSFGYYYAGVYSMLALAAAVERVNVKKDE